MTVDPGFPSRIVRWPWAVTPGLQEARVFHWKDAAGDPYDPGAVTAKAGTDGTISATVTGTGASRTITWSSGQTTLIPGSQWRLNFDGHDWVGGRVGIAQPEDAPPTDDEWTIHLPGDGEGDGLTITVAGGGSAGDWTALVPLTGDLSGDGFADPTDAFGGPGVNPMGLSWRTTADGRILVEGNVLYVASAAPGVPDAGDLIATLPEGARPVRPAAVWATQFNFDTGAVTLAAIGITPAGEIRMQAAPAPVGQLYAIRSEFDPA